MEEEVCRLFQTSGHDDDLITGGIAILASEWGDEVYQSAMRHLVGIEFDPMQAIQHWRGATAHHQLLARSPGHPGLRAALLDYLHRVARQMRDPRIVEAHLLEDIRRASISDGLTGLFQQIYFKTALEKQIAKLAREGGGRFAVVLLDLDHFKQFNDRCGHLAGDGALKTVAEKLRESTRGGDIIARYGGEEFALLLVDVDQQQAFKIAERVRYAIEQNHFPGQELLESGNLTISGGIACYPDEGVTADGLIGRADHELYQAKRQRNAIFPIHRDRRRTFRSKVRSVVEIAPCSSATFQPGLVLDINRLGLTISTPLPVETGMRVRLRLLQPFWPKQLLLQAIVRHIRRDPATGILYAGVEFESPAEPFTQEERGWLRGEDSPGCFPLPNGL